MNRGSQSATVNLQSGYSASMRPRFMNRGSTLAVEQDAQRAGLQ